MKYIIMCAGDGKRWNNYMGIPKHLVEINGETLLGRTTRMLKERNITDYIITGSDERYRQYGTLIPQTDNDCEVDRFQEIDDEEICYLYGDVYYTEDAIDKIINIDTDEILFFGSDMELFAIKIKNKELFFKHKNIIKEKFLKGEIWRCIGWEVYRSINGTPLEEHIFEKRFYQIYDETDDIDCPKNYENFVKKYKGGVEMIKCEATRDFTLEEFDKLKNIQRKGMDTKGKLYNGDTFECDKDMADYLTGGNDKKLVVAKVFEIIPEVIINEEKVKKIVVETKPKKKASKK